MSQKLSILGSKIDFRVRQLSHLLICNVPSYILLDFEKRCQAFPSIANSILIELPSASLLKKQKSIFFKNGEK